MVIYGREKHAQRVYTNTNNSISTNFRNKRVYLYVCFVSKTVTHERRLRLLLMEYATSNEGLN